MKKSVISVGILFLTVGLVFAETNGGNIISLSNGMSNVIQTNTNTSIETARKNTKNSNPRKGVIAGINDFIRMGGVFIWPLLLLSIIGVAYLLERGVFYLHRKVSDESLLKLIKGGGSVKEVQNYLSKHPSRMGDIISEVIRLSEKRPSVEQLDKVLEIGINIQISELQKGFTMIGAVINLAPLVGFLGTVSGMIAAFASIATSDQVSVTLVAKGIQEALVTTEVGLVIAITVNFFYSLFQQSIEKIGQYSIDAGETLIERIVEDEN